jgi:hypothetical protein
MRIRSILQLALAFVLMGALIAAGAFLPARIAESLDGLFLRKIEVQALAPEDEMPPVATPLINRLKLLSVSQFELETLPLKTGGYLDEKTVLDVLDRELEELNARWLYPGPMSPKERAKSVRAQASLYVLAGQPNISGIIWLIDFEDDYFSGRICLDDESGKILSYSIIYTYASARDLFTERSGERWAEYLGLNSDNLRLAEETDESSVNGLEHLHEAATVSLGDSFVIGKTDIYAGIVPEKRFRFLLEAGTSPLEIYCEQFNDERIMSFSLRIVSPGQAGTATAVALDKYAEAMMSGEVTGWPADKPLEPDGITIKAPETSE